MRIDKMPESEEKEPGLQIMQADIHMKGAQLGKVWAELFGLLSKYQAELMVKENHIEIAEQQLEKKKEQYADVSPIQGLEEVAKFEGQLQEKELQLAQCQTELSQTQTKLKQVQIDLSTNMDILDQVQTELLENQTQCVRCQADVERLKADLNIKDEQIRVKDSLLSKIQHQLMKENAELKEQLLQEKSLLEAERLTHSQTKQLVKRLQRRGSRESSSVIEIPDSPPTFDLSCESETQRLSNAIDHDSLSSPQRLSTNNSSFTERLLSSSSKNYGQIGLVDYSMNRVPSSSFSAPSGGLSPSAASTSTSSSRITYMAPSPSQRLLPAKSFSDPRGSKRPHSPSFQHHTNSDKSDNLTSITTSSTPPVDLGLPDLKKDLSDQFGVSESSVMPISGPIPSTSGGTLQSNMELGDGQASDTAMFGRVGEVTSVGTSKVLKCWFCQKLFPSMSKLQVHLRVHTKERPFVCQLCGKTFTQSNNLKRHMITHQTIQM